jgi:hypothetical protein
MNDKKFTQAYIWKDTHERLKTISEILGLSMSDVIGNALWDYEDKQRLKGEVDRRIKDNTLRRG